MELIGTITPNGGLTGFFDHDITDYNLLTNKPQINGETLIGDKSAADLGLQAKITFPQDPTKYLDGEGNFTTPPTIGNYNDLTNKPQINGVTLSGNKTGDDLDLSNKAHVNELSGASVDFQNGQNLPLLKCIADIEPVQSGSGTPSPSNPRPITGWTDVTITVSNDDETETYTAALGQTVYGGTLDVTTGVLTVTKKYATFNNISTWTYDSARTRFQTGHITDMKTVSGSVVNDIITSCTQMYSNNQAWDGHIDGASWTSDDYFYVSLHDYTSVTDLLNAIGNEQIVYPLATPQTVQLTPEKVRTILGVNNISADTGDIDIIYINNVNDPAIEFILNNL